MRILSGVDLVEIERFTRLDRCIADRFVQRVYTQIEIAEGKGSFEYYAGRFAAKEAVVKALGKGIGAIHWQDVEILTGGEGEPILQLHAEAANAARQLGIISWSLSISHTRNLAIAQAVALSEMA